MYIATTLSVENFHKCGDLFADLLRARHRQFIGKNGWDLPQANGMEFDQYDTPASRWIAIHSEGSVVAGIRLTPTTARCGIYSYMLRDAQRGLLDSIPPNVLYEQAPVDPTIWESSRIFVSQEVSGKFRFKVQRDLMFEMMTAAGSFGATSVIGLVPSVWSRWIGRIGLKAKPAGPVLNIGGDDTQAVNLPLRQAVH